MYNALNQAKQAEAVKREFAQAWACGQYSLAARIAEANPDLDLPAVLAGERR
jgi:hypothetical protein